MSSDSTRRAISTLEWKQNQKKKPAAVSKGASAFLGEAADVVAGKYASGPGGPNSPYLSRLSEIQVQDESYIHQQLVKPDEVKPKRPAHRVFVGRGSRSARGLKISVSRKVRFNEADGSPTHKSPQGVTRTSSGSSSSPPGGVKAGRRAGGVKFEDDPVIANSSSSQNQGKEQLPAASTGEQASASANSARASASSYNMLVLAGDAVGATRQQLKVQGSSAAMQASTQLPHASQQQQQQQQQQWQQPPGCSSAGSTMGHAHRPYVGSSSSAAAHTGMISDHSSGDGGIMAKFLETQPYGLDSPGSSGRHVAGTIGRRSSIDPSQLADRHGGFAATDVRSGRRTTDLVDKQLEWLRGSTATSSSSSSSSASTQGATAVPDMTASLGYRPIGIPQELFGRWTNMGATKQPPSHAAAAATDAKFGAAGAIPGEAAGKAPAGASSNSSGSHLSGGRGSQQAASPGNSRPGSGFELASKSSGAAAQARAASPNRRLSATNVPQGRQAADGAGHNLMTRQRTPDSATVHALASSSKPYDALGKANWSAAVPAPGSGLTTARSLPSSGRATPAREPSSPKGSPGFSSVDGSAGRLAGSSSSTWQPTPAGSEVTAVRRSRATASSSSSYVDEKSVGLGGLGSSGSAGVGGHSGQVRRGSRATGSSSSSHGDDHEHWELQAGRRNSLQSTTCSSAGPTGRPAAPTAAKRSSPTVGSAPAAAAKVGSSASSIGNAGRVHLPEIAVRPAAKKH